MTLMIDHERALDIWAITRDLWIKRINRGWDDLVTRHQEAVDAAVRLVNEARESAHHAMSRNTATAVTLESLMEIRGIAETAIKEWDAYLLSEWEEICYRLEGQRAECPPQPEVTDVKKLLEEKP